MDLLIIHQEPHVRRLPIVEGKFHGVVDTGAGADLCLHGAEGDAGGGKAGKNLMERYEGGLSRNNNTLASALTPHVNL